jgi:hypothetical protein
MSDVDPEPRLKRRTGEPAADVAEEHHQRHHAPQQTRVRCTPAIRCRYGRYVCRLAGRDPHRHRYSRIEPIAGARSPVLALLLAEDFDPGSYECGHLQRSC